MSDFVAIDFETACNAKESACAVGIVRVSEGRIVGSAYHLIRPPTREFRFTWVHGITWADVQSERHFGEIWPDVEPLFDGATFISAHNAGFDRGVLYACCAAYGLNAPSIPFLCTVQLARSLWQLRPTKLPDVCRFLAISLDHHRADSDSRACAEIVIAALQDGWRYA